MPLSSTEPHICMTSCQFDQHSLTASFIFATEPKFWIKPVGTIDELLIEEEWPQLQRIFVTLAMKETTQSTIVKKLCTYSYSNRTKKALFEYDKLVRSIYTLEYLMNPELLLAVEQKRVKMAKLFGDKKRAHD